MQEIQQEVETKEIGPKGGPISQAVAPGKKAKPTTPFYIGRKFPLNGVLFEITGTTEDGFTVSGVALTNKGRRQTLENKKLAERQLKQAHKKTGTKQTLAEVYARVRQIAAEKAKARLLRQAKREANELIQRGDETPRNKLVLQIYERKVAHFFAQDSAAQAEPIETEAVETEVTENVPAAA
jgi:hypothetical protein